MRKLILSSILALPMLLLLTADANARGGRGGGGFRGGAHNMGSVRHSRYRQNPGPEHRSPEHRGPQRYDPHHRDRHRPIDRPAARAEKHRIARGTRIRHLPRGYRRYRWSHRYWYFAAGIWYVASDDQNDPGYVVMDPEAGMTVDSLPEGTEHVVVHGRTLYASHGIYYKAVWTNGSATYTVVNV